MLPPRPDLGPVPEPPPGPARSSWRDTVGLVLALVVGAVVGRLALALGEAMGLDIGLDLDVGFGLPWWGVLSVTLTAILAVLTTHEVGHLIGGRLAGFRFVLLVVGPLHVEREGERLRWRLNRSLAMAGGLALSIPTDAGDSRQGTALMVAAGPVASVILGGLSMAAASAAPGGWSDLALFVGVTSLVIALVTMWPAQMGGSLTDGARLLRLARGGPAAEREAAIFAVIAQTTLGVRPRDWDPAAAATLEASTDADPLAEGAWALLTARAFDTGDAEAARRILAQRVEGWSEMPGVSRAGLAADAALFEAAVRGDAERARAWLEHIPTRGLTDDSQVEMARAAMHAAAGDPGAAAASAKVARAALDGAFDAGTARARRDWLAPYAEHPVAS